MLFSFFQVSLRSIFKHRVSSLISIGSLTLGILFAFVIFKFTAFERSFDQFVPDYAQKVRMNFHIRNGGDLTVNAATAPYPYTDLFVPQSPEIAGYARFYNAGNGILSYEDRVSLKTDGITFADESLLDFFGVALVEGGNIEDNDLRSVVISETLSRQLFGTESATGKTITYLGTHDFVVKGVFADLPANSSVDFQLVGAMDFLQTLRPQYYQDGKNWGGYAFHTYYQLSTGTDRVAMEANLNELYRKRNNINSENTPVQVFEFSLISIEDIHLRSDLVREQNSGSSEAKIKLMEYLAFIILAIAWINFINLQSTKAPQRMKEIGVRKVFGAGKEDLYSLFILEFGLLNLISLWHRCIAAFFFESLPGRPYHCRTGPHRFSCDGSSRADLLPAGGHLHFYHLPRNPYREKWGERQKYSCCE